MKGVVQYIKVVPNAGKPSDRFICTKVDGKEYVVAQCWDEYLAKKILELVKSPFEKP